MDNTTLQNITSSFLNTTLSVLEREFQKKYLNYYGDDYSFPEQFLMFIIVCLSSLSFLISIRISMKYHQFHFLFIMVFAFISQLMYHSMEVFTLDKYGIKVLNMDQG